MIDVESADVDRLEQFLRETELDSLDARDQARIILRRFGELDSILGDIVARSGR